MNVSKTWFQICSYPLLWKSLYFKEGWTIAEEVMSDFDTRLRQMQTQFDIQYKRFRQFLLSSDTKDECPAFSDDEIDSVQSGRDYQESSYQARIKSDRIHLYAQFFNCFDQAKPSEIRQKFHDIARFEIGEPFSNTATFVPNDKGTVRVHIDWRYIYLNRSLLEDNWRKARYQPTLLDGAPDITDPNQREGIYCVYFDRNILAAGSRDKLIRLWSMQDFRYLRSLESHEGSVLCLQLDSRRGILVSGSSDSSIKVWDLHDGKVSQTLRGHSESVLGLHFEAQHIVSCSKDTTARIWGVCDDTTQSIPADPLDPGAGDVCAGALPRYVLLHTLKGHRAAVNSVHFKGNTIATASGDRTVRLWNLITGIMIRTIGAHPRGIACVNMAGSLVVTGSSDHVIKIFDMADGEEVRTLRGHSGLVRTIQADNTKIISGSYDQSIRIWDIHSGEMHELEKCHDSK
jgi:WD40 repeat protein